MGCRASPGCGYFFGATAVKKLFIILGSIAGAITGIGTIWAALDWLDVRPVLARELKEVQAQIQTLTDKQILIEWSQLDAKLKQNGGLDFQEKQRYCSLSRALGYVGIPECGF